MAYSVGQIPSLLSDDDEEDDSDVGSNSDEEEEVDSDEDEDLLPGILPKGATPKSYSGLPFPGLSVLESPGSAAFTTAGPTGLPTVSTANYFPQQGIIAAPQLAPPTAPIAFSGLPSFPSMSQIQVAPIQMPVGILMPSIQVQPSIRGPPISIQAPVIQMPQIGIQPPAVQMPHIGIQAPAIRAPVIQMPQTGVQAPVIQMPQIGVQAPVIQMPQTGIQAPVIQMPQMPQIVQAPAIQMSQIGIQTPIQTQQIGIQAPSISLPQIAQEPILSTQAPTIQTASVVAAPVIPTATTQTMPTLPPPGNTSTVASTEEILTKLGTLTIIGFTQPPTSTDVTTIDDLIIREAGESPEDFEIRRALTKRLASIPNYLINPVAAVVAGLLFARKVKLDLKYSEEIEAVLIQLQKLLQSQL